MKELKNPLTQNEFETVLKENQFLPLLTWNGKDDLNKIISNLKTKNINVIEIAMRNEFALKAIKEISENSNIIVGVGSIKSIEDMKEALTAGAQFIVTPAIVEEVIEYCKKQNTALLTGISTPSELQKVYEHGFEIAKVFPAEELGGATYIKAIVAPYPNMKFVPTGGINKYNYKDYQNINSVLAVGGSFICK